MAEGSGTKWWIHFSTKFLVKMKKYVFSFYLKTEGTFGQPNIYIYNRNTVWVMENKLIVTKGKWEQGGTK